MGATIVEGVEGNDVNKAQFVLMSTNFYFWKNNFPQLKISRPVEDMCLYCFAFTNRHRFLANHATQSNTQNDEPMEDVVADDDMIEDEPLFYDELIAGFQSLAVEDGPIIDIDM